MIRGIAEVTLDEKGRISVPSEFRESIELKYGPTLVVSMYDKCLVAFPEGVWEEIEKSLHAKPASANRAAMFRSIYSRIATCQIKNGRVLIPTHLRQHAKLEKDVVLIAQGNRMEVWSKDLWQKYEKEQAEKFSPGDFLNEF